MGQRATRLNRVVAQQQAQPQIGLGDAPRGIDARSERKPTACAAVGRSRACATSSNAAMPGTLAPRHHLQPLATSARFNAGQRHHVAHGRQRHEVEQPDQIRLALRALKKPLAAQLAHVATAARNATPVAHSDARPEAQSSRFGLTVATTAGGGPSALW